MDRWKTGPREFFSEPARKLECRRTDGWEGGYGWTEVMGGRIGGWVGEWSGGWLDGWVSGWMAGLMDGRRAEGQTDEWSIPRFHRRFGGHARKIVPTVTNCSQHLHGSKQIVSVVDDCSRIEDAQFRSDPRVVADGVHSSRLSPRWKIVPTVAEKLRQLPLPDSPPPRCPLSVTVPMRMWSFRQIASAAADCPPRKKFVPTMAEGLRRLPHPDSPPPRCPVPTVVCRCGAFDGGRWE